ncbi:hypothetical protein J1605_004603 [Eschrichtius robustus]|uniref:Uncharacterized protein n=1 Tax=Eschrichtius robustus TaxID=9764 RepID=A0AB34HI05_ESCRO|nr:hypothetical protein J1605_004603 [Eschrichtius robustus]
MGAARPAAAVTDASVGPRLQGSPRESIAVGEGPAEPAVSLLVWTGTGCFPAAGVDRNRLLSSLLVWTGTGQGWEGENENEVGRCKETGKVHVTVDLKYYRPTEVNSSFPRTWIGLTALLGVASGVTVFLQVKGDETWSPPASLHLGLCRKQHTQGVAGTRPEKHSM